MPKQNLAKDDIQDPQTRKTIKLNADLQQTVSSDKLSSTADTQYQTLPTDNTKHCRNGQLNFGNRAKQKMQNATNCFLSHRSQ
jgi:hypothetical protein